MLVYLKLVLISFQKIFILCLRIAVYPNNQQFSAHFREFVVNGYRLDAEAIVTKFPFADGTRAVEDFTVGVVDGLTKVIICLSIVSFIVELELKPEQVQEISHALQTFKFLRCSYHHYDNPAQLHLLALRTSIQVLDHRLLVDWEPLSSRFAV